MASAGEMSVVDFLFDFGSPNAYLAHRVIPAIEDRTGVRFRYMPVLLGGIFKATHNRSPMEAFAEIPAKLAFMEVETRRFLARHAITDFKMNPYFPLNTLGLMRGAIAAEREGCFQRYVDVIFHNIWSEPKQLDDPSILAEVLEENGFDAAALLARAQDPDVKATLITNTEAAVARGAFGSPTFFVGDEMFFGKDQLRDAEDAIMPGKRTLTPT